MTLDEHITQRVRAAVACRGISLSELHAAVKKEGLSHHALNNCLAGRSSWTKSRRLGSYAVDKVARALGVEVHLLLPAQDKVIGAARLIALLAPLLEGET